LREKQQARAASELIGNMKERNSNRARIASKFVAGVERRRNDVAPLLAHRERNQVAERATHRAVAEQVVEAGSRRNNNVIADGHAEGISVLLGQNREFGA